MVLAAGGLSLRPFEGNHELNRQICRPSLPACPSLNPFHLSCADTVDESYPANWNPTLTPANDSLGLFIYPLKGPWKFSKFIFRKKEFFSKMEEAGSGWEK